MMIYLKVRNIFGESKEIEILDFNASHIEFKVDGIIWQVSIPEAIKVKKYFQMKEEIVNDQ